jgi:hypothetical protein
MSKCDFAFALEKPDARFRPGEVVRGRLDVRVLDDCTCTALTLALDWRTHGKGNVAKGGRPPEVLAQAETWKAGEQRSYPFALAMPSVPVSYHGHLVNLDWFLLARADVPWAIDPKGEAEVFLLPAPEQLVERADGGGYREPARRSATRFGRAASPRAQGCAPLAVAVMGGLALIFGLVLLGRDVGGGVMVALVGGVMFVIGGATALRRPMAESRLGAPAVVVEPADLRAGESVRVRIELQPKSRVHLNGLSLELRGQEVVVSGSGSNATTHKHDLHQRTIELSPGGLELEAGASRAFAGEAAIPLGAAPSFDVRDNAVRWWLVVRADIEGWPDWVEEYVLTVR